MEVESDTLRRLMEVGYLAVGSGMAPQAETIFAGVAACRPASELPYIGRAMAYCSQNRAQEGIAELEAALRANPQSDLAKSFLGFALRLAGLQGRSDTLLQEVVASNRDAQAVGIAKSLLAAEAN